MSGDHKKDEDDSFVLQAIVLTDSFERRFRPISLETPRCLMPLANAPLINYTLDFLSSSGVEEVYIFASAHSKQVEEYISSSQWAQKPGPFKIIQVLALPKLESVGDAMRELDGRRIIKGDFVVVTGDLVTNMVLGPALEEHRKRRAKSKDAIMTMVLREGNVGHKAMDRGDKAIFVVESPTGRCLHYERVPPNTKKPFLSLPSEVLESHDVDIRHDLIDCYVDICSPDVPALFTENFDYSHIRGHFVHGILRDHELYGKTIYCHIINDKYAARVRSLQTYDAVTRDVVSRWVYPICVDHNLFDDQNYTYLRSNIYKEKNVSLERTSVIKSNTILGSGTKIGAKAVISQSVVGRRCVIGEGSTLTGSYLWNDVIIGSNTEVGKALLASGVVIGSNCKIQSGAVIAANVKIADNTTVYGNSAITLLTSPSALEDGAQEIPTDEAAVGKSGSGHIYEESESDSDERSRIDASSLVRPDSALSASSTDSISSVSTTGSSRSRSPSRPRKSLEEDAPESFFKEAYSQLLTGLQNSHPVEVVALELTSLRMTHDAPFSSVRRAAASAIVSRAVQVQPSSPPAKSIPAMITPWKEVWERMIFSRGDQVDFILDLQKACVGVLQGGVIFFSALKTLYEVDVIEEEAVMAWNGDVRGKGEEMESVRGLADKFVAWLEQASEEEEEEEEEESEEESDEE